MTLPDERYRSIQWAERFLKEIATDRKKYPRVPAAVRREAYSILRHYPTSWDLDRLAAAAPEVVAARMEDLHRFVRAGEQNLEATMPLDKDHK